LDSLSIFTQFICAFLRNTLCSSIQPDDFFNQSQGV
jgi:hypothetical protein